MHLQSYRSEEIRNHVGTNLTHVCFQCVYVVSLLFMWVVSANWPVEHLKIGQGAEYYWHSLLKIEVECSAVLPYQGFFWATLAFGVGPTLIFFLCPYKSASAILTSSYNLQRSERKKVCRCNSCLYCIMTCQCIVRPLLILEDLAAFHDVICDGGRDGEGRGCARAGSETL